MSIRQDRLTFFGVLIAVVIAVIGYLQIGALYPVQGQAQSTPVRGDEAEKTTDEPSGLETEQPLDTDP